MDWDYECGKIVEVREKPITHFHETKLAILGDEDSDHNSSRFVVRVL